MKKPNKKGFTLVELLVVIAILAILATVSIIGYTAFIKKANVSNDTALAKQINDLLLANETTEGKPKTLGEALEIVNENGFDIAKLTPTATAHDFVYDSSTNRFALLDANQKAVYSDGELSQDKTQLWVIRADATNLPEGYSVYFTNPVENVTLTKLVGVEGEIGTLSIIDETSTATVTIAGNIQSGTINAPNATVYHYGEMGSLTINAISGNSWHEFGTIMGNVNVAKGRFVAEKGSSVGAVVVTSAVAFVKAEEGAAVGGVVTTESGLNLSTQVQGVSQDVVSSEIVSQDTLNLFGGGIGTEGSPYLISNMEQLKNISAATDGYFKLTDDLTFAVGDLANYKWSGYDWYSYFCVKDFGGVFDGNGHTITLPENMAMDNTTGNASVFDKLSGATVNNLKIANAKLAMDIYDCTINDITVSGSLTFANNEGVLCSYSGGTNHFNRCVVKANITSSSYSAVFVGSHNSTTNPVYLNFSDCHNEGTYVGEESAMFVGNAYGKANLYLNVENCGNRNGGSVRGTKAVNSYVAKSLNTTTDTLILNGKETSFDVLLGSGFLQGPNDTLALRLNDDKTFAITKSSISTVDHYVVQVMIYASTPTGTQMFSVSETIDNFDEETQNTTIKYLPFTNVGTMQEKETLGSWKVVTENGNDYYLFDKEGYTITNKAKPSIVKVLAYDESGNLLSSAELVK